MVNFIHVFRNTLEFSKIDKCGGITFEGLINCPSL